MCKNTPTVELINSEIVPRHSMLVRLCCQGRQLELYHPVYQEQFLLNNQKGKTEQSGKSYPEFPPTSVSNTDSLGDLGHVAQ